VSPGPAASSTADIFVSALNDMAKQPKAGKLYRNAGANYVYASAPKGTMSFTGSMLQSST